MTFRQTIYTNTSKRIIDAFLGGIAFWIAYQLRFEAQIPPSYEFQLWLLLPGIMLGRVLANSLLGVNSVRPTHAQSCQASVPGSQKVL